MIQIIQYFLLAGFFVFQISCGPKAFVKGQYDKDIERENLLNDQWSETDMQKIVAELVTSLGSHVDQQKLKNRPVVIVTKLQNKTSEHIDTQSIMDMVRVELMQSGKFRFIDKEARSDISEEYDYQGSGVVSADTKKGPGSQIGADYIINGRLDSITQEVGKEKTVYYKVTLNLTDLKTSEIAWTGQKQIRKLYKKRTIGL